MLTNDSLLIVTKFFLDNTPKDITVTDGTIYGASTPATPTSAVRGLLRITGPNGIFHVNAGYSSNDFSSPDIDGSVGIVKSGMPLPLDANGNVLQGSYMFDYKVGLRYNAISFVDGFNNFVFLNDATGLLSAGVKFTILGSLSNNGEKTVVSAIYNVGLNRTVVTISETVVAENPSDGFAILQVLEKRFTYNYCFIAPEISISVVANCFCSRLTSTDTSTYTATCNEQSISPTLIQRVHTINYPFGSNPSDPIVTGNGAVLTTVENIWTGVFNTSLVTTLNYVLSGGLLLQMGLSTQRSTEVVCNDCICDMLECVSALNTRYSVAIGRNKRLADELEPKLIRINTEGLLFANAVNCGDWDLAQSACDNMKVLLAADCDCCNDVPDGSQEVQPLCTSGAGGSNLSLIPGGNGIEIAVSGDGLTYTFTLNQTIVTNIVEQYITTNNIDNSGGIVLEGILTNCFGITNGMTLTTAWNELLTELCDLIDRYIIGKDDFKDDGQMELPFADYPKSTLSYVDSSGGGNAIIRIDANDYYVDGQNIEKLQQDVLLFNNSDNYIYLDNTDDFEWKVTAVPIGDPAPNTSGTKIYMVTTGAGAISLVTQLIGYYPVNESNSAFETVYILTSPTVEKETNGNFRFIPIGGSLYLQQRVGGNWNNIMKF